MRIRVTLDINLRLALESVTPLDVARALEVTTQGMQFANELTRFGVQLRRPEDGRIYVCAIEIVE